MTGAFLKVGPKAVAKASLHLINIQLLGDVQWGGQCLTYTKI
jgi:hypothetical protein